MQQAVFEKATEVLEGMLRAARRWHGSHRAGHASLRRDRAAPAADPEVVHALGRERVRPGDRVRVEPAGCARAQGARGRGVSVRCGRCATRWRLRRLLVPALPRVARRPGGTGHGAATEGGGSPRPPRRCRRERPRAKSLSAILPLVPRGRRDRQHDRRDRDAARRSPRCCAELPERSRRAAHAPGARAAGYGGVSGAHGAHGPPCSRRRPSGSASRTHCSSRRRACSSIAERPPTEKIRGGGPGTSRRLRRSPGSPVIAPRPTRIYADELSPRFEQLEADPRRRADRESGAMFEKRGPARLHSARSAT